MWCQRGKSKLSLHSIIVWNHQPSSSALIFVGYDLLIIVQPKLMYVCVILSDPYLEVTMHDAVLVQVADSLQHLLDHAAGILLWVNPPVQNTIEKLPAWNAGQNKPLPWTFPS